MSWEQAVQWLREQPGQQQLARDCYYDDPLADAAQRFWHSAEWQATAQLLDPARGRALDLGAGRGISSYALARDGWQVTALEPDDSALVGAGAIRTLAAETGLPITVVGEHAERLPFADASFDLVHCRQALHHARDLPASCREMFRVLRPGGAMVATREHVISERGDLQAFLDSHPLHHLYGGENALLLDEYLAAMRQAGFAVERVIAPFDSPINYFPMTGAEVFEACAGDARQRLGQRLSRVLLSNHNPLGRAMRRRLLARANARDRTPGRLYSFLCRKPRA